MSRVERGALEGSAVAANASRRRLIHDERLTRRLAPLQAACQAAAPGHPPDDVPAWMANTSHTRTAQSPRYRQAPDHLALVPAANQRRRPSERRPPAKIVVSTGDPAAALGLDNDHVFRPLDTIQTIRDVEAPLLLRYDVCAQATDAGTLPPMLARTAQRTGRRLPEGLVDRGDVTGGAWARCAAEGVRLSGPWQANDRSAPKASALCAKEPCQWWPELDASRCPAGDLLKRRGREKRMRSGGREEVLWRYEGKAQTCHACPLRAQCTTSPKGRSLRRSAHEDTLVAHRAWMETEAAKMG